MNTNTLAITGGTSGIGLVTTKTLLSKGWRVILLARNLRKAETLKRLKHGKNLDIIACDLSSMNSVQEAAKQIMALDCQVDVLMNNAGAIFQRRETTEDGFEKTLAANHLGHFVLTLGALKKLLKSKTKIINISSSAHRIALPDFEDLSWTKRKYSPIKAYADSKLYNIYFTQGIHSRYFDSGVTSFALHPGAVKTNFASDTTGIYNILLNLISPFMISPERGAETQTFLAESSGLEKYSGRYFEKKALGKIAPEGKNQENSEKLWKISEELTQKWIQN